MRHIDPVPFIGSVTAATEFGREPELVWIPIAQLVIDDQYQRTISKLGGKNVKGIAEKFRWSKFAPVIVAKASGTTYSVIDGQHRVTAAAVVGIKKVPCQVVAIDRAHQADALAAINGNVTLISSLQLHIARLAAGDDEARRLVSACEEAGVSICRYPIPASQLKRGETLAVGVLGKCLRQYGRPTLVAALKCITETGDGNAGLVRAAVIEGLCAVLEGEPEWRDGGKQLIAAMNQLDLAQTFNEATITSRRDKITVAAAMVDAVSAHLEETFGKA